MADKKGNSLWGWLGRQVGHVSRAIKTDVSKETKIVYRKEDVKEAPHPTDPELKLRRTVRDEVIRKEEEE